MREAVIVAYGRSAIGKSPKGTLKDTRPEDFAAQVIKGVLAKVPALDPAQIDDIIMGCAFQEAETGTNVARNIGLLSGIPESVPAQTINRFCSSGLQAISMGANAIKVGEADVILAGGVEHMSMIPMGGNLNVPVVSLAKKMPSAMTAMGNTAENVAEKYEITREAQDTFAMGSHAKAIVAQDEGRFDEQIIPVDAVKYKTDETGKVVKYIEPFTKDEGVRHGLTTETLAKLKTVFKKGGTVTAGNASQMNDAAAYVVLMSKEKADELGLKPIAKFVNFAVGGVDPAYMGLGPTVAVPKVLKLCGLKTEDIDVWELNEAFSSQALACIKLLGLEDSVEKVNPNGGGVALGHPLGCTGAMLTCKLLAELKRTNKKYGVVTMCIGGGMGAAGVFEMC